MDRTNESATGYTYGGQQYKKETRTDSQGNTYTVDIPTAISTAQLLPTQPMNIPQVPQNTTNTTGIVNGLVSGLPELDKQVSGQEGKVDSLSNLLIQSYQNQAAIPTQQAEMEKAAGIADTQKEVLALQNRLRALGAQAQSNILSEQNKATGQNITATAVQRNIGDLNRQVAIDSLTTSAMLQAKQGDLALAQDQIAKAIELKYKQEENRINILKQSYDMNKDILERYDKKRADALALKLKQEERDYNEKKANDTKIGELVTNAASQGAPSALVAKAQAAKTPMEAAGILGVYSGDYLSTQIKKAQLAKLGLENQEAYNKLYSTSPNGLRSLSYEENAKFNSTPEAKAVKDATAYAKAVADYKAAIEKYGTGELVGEGSGALGQTYSALVGATKDYYTLGTLDNGVQKLIALGIPEPGVLGLKKGRIDALDTALTAASDTIKRNTDQLLATSYKNTNELRQLTDNANSVLMYRLSNQDLLNSIPGASANTTTSNSTNSNFFNK